MSLHTAWGVTHIRAELATVTHERDTLRRVLALIFNGVPPEPGSTRCPEDCGDKGWMFLDSSDPPPFWNRGTLADFLRSRGMDDEAANIEDILKKVNPT